MFQNVSNAGIVFKFGAKIVGIDCLCKDSSRLYQDTSVEVREQLRPDILIFTTYGATIIQILIKQCKFFH